jgi:hypothetical protein
LITVEDKLNEFDLFDNSIIKHGNCENVRDYEIIGYLSGQYFDVEVRYVFKGCIEARFENIVKPEYFSMDDRLLDLTKQNAIDYPEGFVWAAGTIVYPGWKLEENTEVLKELETLYNLKFYKLFIETNAYNLDLVFHDLEVTLRERYNKSDL